VVQEFPVNGASFVGAVSACCACAVRPSSTLTLLKLVVVLFPHIKNVEPSLTTSYLIVLMFILKASSLVEVLFQVNELPILVHADRSVPLYTIVPKSLSALQHTSPLGEMRLHALSI
jgi:hypothetical protein